jgi:hypothetical protein
VHEKCVCRSKPGFQRIIEAQQKGSFNKLKRHLGLEIEISKLGTITGINERFKGLRYQWVRDGSVTPGGMEMVVAPLVGDMFVEGMVWLARMFEEHGCEVDISCGLHVHVEGLDLGAFEMRRILTVYNKVEKEMFKGLVDPSRWGNRYCRPYELQQEFEDKLWEIKDHGELRRFFLKWLYPDLRRIDTGGGVKKPGYHQVQQTKRHKYQQCRYFGVNFHSWMQRGTIEWRQCQGTLDVERLLFWPLWCGWFVEIVGGLKDEEARGIRGLKDLVDGVWKRPFAVLGFPEGVREWVKKESGLWETS